jgi:hypothetical protein
MELIGLFRSHSVESMEVGAPQEAHTMSCLVRDDLANDQSYFLS